LRYLKLKLKSEWMNEWRYMIC